MHEEEMIMAIGAMITAVFVIRIIAGAITRIVCHWCDASLKMRLVESGMGAKEIEQVILAGKSRGCGFVQKPAKQVAHEYGL